ncbi:hypothetical protein CONPUDRAFT_164703 [Coniophora puteana RWD-64-598 SS2]|uniref:Uncharacterized protein n=1 Tax=Coniophora puteana (strain RWD-64-598) TaxID=741705 RepID=A0A5M3MTH6_CONPW|nr:uncharacterized protein CONPUDRAFT_164703 [Coniophora puteana RWD-64-598 SS2]EIW82054.1 hypothetical protein CONPUDRAFT_164703 [Coniophora puteana RWD-64-598 SS2]
MLKTWVRSSTPEARNIVRQILATASQPEIGLTPHEIFERAGKEHPDATTPTPIPTDRKPSRHFRNVPQPPRLAHPIRSLKYLKRVVLEEMAERNEVEKVYIRKGPMTPEGTRQLSIKSKSQGASEILGIIKSTNVNVWLWRLRPDFADSGRASRVDAPRSPHPPLLTSDTPSNSETASPVLPRAPRMEPKSSHPSPTSVSKS